MSASYIATLPLTHCTPAAHATPLPSHFLPRPPLGATTLAPVPQGSDAAASAREAEAAATRIAAPSMRTVERFVESVKESAGRSLESVPTGLVIGELERWLSPMPPAVAGLRGKLVRAVERRLRETNVNVNRAASLNDIGAHAVGADAATNLLRSAVSRLGGAAIMYPIDPAVDPPSHALIRAICTQTHHHHFSSAATPSKT